MPMWNRLLPQRSVPARSICDESLFQRVLVAVEADQAAHQEHREADVRIDAEQKVVNATFMSELLV